MLALCNRAFLPAVKREHNLDIVHACRKTTITLQSYVLSTGFQLDYFIVHLMLIRLSYNMLLWITFKQM